MLERVRAQKRVAEPPPTTCARLERARAPLRGRPCSSRAKPSHQSAAPRSSPSPVARAICDGLFEERHRLRVDVPIARHSMPERRSRQRPSSRSRFRARRTGRHARASSVSCRVVPERAADGDARYVAAASATALALAGSSASKPAVRARRSNVSAAVEPAVHPEERVEGCEHLRASSSSSIGDGPLGRGAEVVELAAQLVPRASRAPGRGAPPCRSASIAEVVARMALAGRPRARRAIGGELLGRVLAQQLVQLEAAEVRAAHERLRDELGEQAQVGARDRGRGARDRSSPRNTESRARTRSLLVGEQPPRLVEGGAEAAMPLRHVAHRRGEEVDVPLDLVRDLRAGEHRHPRGRELDAERHALDQPADAERLRRARRRRARSPARPASRARRRGAARRSAPVPVLREAEAVDVEHPLALHVETLTRRRQQLDVRGALDDLAQQVRRPRRGARSCRARAASTAR